MSYYADVVVWQSADGTWSMGSHPEDYVNCDSEDPDYCDHEWCREFDQNSFGWVSGGHPTADAAWKSWDQANHGGGEECSFDASAGPVPAVETPGEDGLFRHPNSRNEHYDDLAAKLCEAEAAKPRERSPYSWGNVYRAYNGPVRARTLKAVQAERNKLRADWYGHRLGGYANGLPQEEAALTARINEMLKAASPAEREAFRLRQVQHLDVLNARKKRHEEEQRKQNSYRSYGYYSYNPDAARMRAAQQAAREEAETYRAAVEASTIAPPAPKPAQAPPPSPVPAPAAKPPAKRASAKETQPAKPPAKKAPVKKAAAPARRKTTAKSTSTSFATPLREEAPAMDLTPPAAPGPDDPWGDLPDR